MKVFISWSKPASRQLGEILRDWLPEVIQQVDPWMSSEDIDKGQRWATEIGAKLGELSQGILCVTAQNVHEPWLNFEAGALSRSLDSARVRPVLLDLHPSEVTGPLAQLQGTVATDRADMFKLVRSLNAACSVPLDVVRLERSFSRNYDAFLERAQAAANPASEAVAVPHRKPEDMIAEILEIVREMRRSDSQPNAQGYGGYGHTPAGYGGPAATYQPVASFASQGTPETDAPTVGYGSTPRAGWRRQPSAATNGRHAEDSGGNDEPTQPSRAQVSRRSLDWLDD